MVVRISNIVSGADTATQGQQALQYIRKALSDEAGVVTVSFKGIQSATSSFVNASFVALLADYSLPTIKQRLRIVESTRQINDMIKTRLEREAMAAA